MTCIANGLFINSFPIESMPSWDSLTDRIVLSFLDSVDDDSSQSSFGGVSGTDSPSPCFIKFNIIFLADVLLN